MPLPTSPILPMHDLITSILRWWEGAKKNLVLKYPSATSQKIMTYFITVSLGSLFPLNAIHPRLRANKSLFFWKVFISIINQFSGGYFCRVLERPPKLFLLFSSHFLSCPDYLSFLLSFLTPCATSLKSFSVLSWSGAKPTSLKRYRTFWPHIPPTDPEKHFL